MFIQIESDSAQMDDLLSLQRYLQAESELRGRVEGRHISPGSGAMGTIIDALTITLGSGGATSVIFLVSTWLKQRTTDLTVKLSDRSGQTIEVQATRVKRMTTEELMSFVDDLQQKLGDTSAS